jgi:hypothetical protein
MKEPIDETEPAEDEVVEVDEDLEDAEPSEAELAEATVPIEPAEPAAAEVESIQELLVKQEARAEE